ncbi:hypothetical protein ABW19_dt0201149 [Dactylella cylindrospora]|nr:hypothetical protein ABW19_dt0201149 [Dactylella cylindrospora]
MPALVDRYTQNHRYSKTPTSTSTHFNSSGDEAGRAHNSTPGVGPEQPERDIQHQEVAHPTPWPSLSRLDRKMVEEYLKNQNPNIESLLPPKSPPLLNTRHISLTILFQVIMGASAKTLNPDQGSRPLPDTSRFLLSSPSPDVLSFFGFLLATSVYIASLLSCCYPMFQCPTLGAAYSIWAIAGVTFWFALGATASEVVTIFFPLTLNFGLFIEYIR